MRGWIYFLGWLMAVGVMRADQAADLMAIHVEVIGGRERIAALKSLRATGFVFAGGKKVRFSQTTARPNRVRQEIGTAERSLVQAWDGVKAPWKFDTAALQAGFVDMPEAEAKLFMADAEFDDPLMAGKARGFSIDYAGELNAKGRKLIRFLVTRNLTDTYSVLMDAETYFIVARIEQRTSAGGRKIEIATLYDDYRPIDGVMLPHQVSVQSEGQMKQVVVIQSIEANPPVNAETFARPVVPAPDK